MSQKRSAAPEKSDRERYCDGYTKENFVEEGSDARSELGSFSSLLEAGYRKKIYRSDEVPFRGLRRSDGFSEQTAHAVDVLKVRV